MPKFVREPVNQNPAIFTKESLGFRKVTPTYNPSRIENKINTQRLNATDVGSVLSAIIKAGENNSQQRKNQFALRKNTETALNNLDNRLREVAKKMNKPASAKGLLSLSRAIRGDLRLNNIRMKTIRNMDDLGIALRNYRNVLKPASKGDSGRVKKYSEDLTTRLWTAYSMVLLTVASTNGKGVPDVTVSQVIKAANFIKATDKFVLNKIQSKKYRNATLRK